jgi:hypothetical protein
VFRTIFSKVSLPAKNSSEPIVTRWNAKSFYLRNTCSTPNATDGTVEEFWMRQKYNSFMDYPAIAMKLPRAATPELATLIQDALRRRNELAS